MWKEFLWNDWKKKSFHRACGKLLKTTQRGCGKKVLAALRKTPVIHISFHYVY